MPTISGMRRRGYTPEGIREFAQRIGISKSENIVDMAVLESAVRDDLEDRAPRVTAVIRPLKVSITNFAGAQARTEKGRLARRFLSRRMTLPKCPPLVGND